MTAPVRDVAPWLARILPGLRGERLDASAVAEFPLFAATVTTPPNPVPTGLAPSLFAGAGPSNFRRTLPDLIPAVTMTGGVLQVPNLTIGVNAARPHAEGAAKNEAALSFAGSVQKAASIATWVRVTDELLDDVAGLDSWLRLYLPWLVKLAEESEILSDGTTSNIKGVFTPGLVPVYAGAASGIAAIVGDMLATAAKSGGFMPDTIVINSADAGALFASPGTNVLDLDAGTYGGVSLIVSGALSAGQIAVGPFQSLAVIGREGGIVVEGTNSHAADFASNISAVRAQSRLAFGLLLTNSFIVKAA